MNRTLHFLCSTFVLFAFLCSEVSQSFAIAADWVSVPLQSEIDRVQPWTGIVLWTDHERVDTDAIQLEYSYMRYDDVAIAPGKYDWSKVDRLLDEVAGRGHQAILRFHYVFPGRPASVPAFITSRDDYQEVAAKSEGKKTGFVDWSCPAIEQFTLDFYREFSKRYDEDPRLAYLQTGFGLWAEYHIYSGPRKIRETFPSREFQATFFQHLDSVFDKTPWMISVDAADGDYSPFEAKPKLLDLKFGVFDDSFLCKQHPKYNAANWRFLGPNRWQHSPGGGEFSYYNKRDQKLALSESGPNGTAFEDSAKQFHITFMIGNDQPKYQGLDRIRDASMATGYRLRVTKCERSSDNWRVVVANEGIAPLYHDAYVSVGQTRSSTSLRLLLPGQERTLEVSATDSADSVTIESDRLVEGQQIQFAADLL